MTIGQGNLSKKKGSIWAHSSRRIRTHIDGVAAAAESSLLEPQARSRERKLEMASSL